MTERTALLAAIIANPAEDSVRLGMADWYEEHNEPERAEFIRVQCELATLEGCPSVGEEYGSIFCRIPPGCRRCELRRRERELFENGYTYRWGFPKAFPSTPFAEDYAKGRGEMYGLITRGFVSRVTCTAELFLSHAPQLVWHPEMTDECSRCRGHKVLWRVVHAGGQKDEIRCGQCSGTGRIPRPCPESAQPLVSVKLLTMPLIQWVEVGKRKLCDGSIVVDFGSESEAAKGDKVLPELLKAEFPGIVFELP